jgi:hypothetical protein
MPASHRRRIRIGLVGLLLLVGMLLGINALYGQQRRPPVIWRTQPANPGLPPGITPAPPLPGGPPLNPPVNPGTPGPQPGGPGTNPGNPGLPLPPGWGTNPAPNPPNGVPGNPGGAEMARTYTCPNCGVTFTIFGAFTLAQCSKCGAKFDVSNGDTGAPPFPQPPTPPGGPNVITPPDAGPPSLNPPGFDPNPPLYPSSTGNVSQPSAGRVAASGLAVLIGLGVVLLGVLLIGGVVLFIIIARSMETSSAGNDRPRPRRRRSYNA